MSEKLKSCCPVCGANDWEVIGTRCICRICDTTMKTKNINKRVIQWVPVAERLPEDEKEHHVKSDMDDFFVCKFVDGKWRIWDDGIKCYRKFIDEVTHWLDDHTFDKEKS